MFEKDSTGSYQIPHGLAASKTLIASVILNNEIEGEAPFSEAILAASLSMKKMQGRFSSKSLYRNRTHRAAHISISQMICSPAVVRHALTI